MGPGTTKGTIGSLLRLEVGKSVFSATRLRVIMTSEELVPLSYHVLQVIQSDTGNKTYLFRKWGRMYGAPLPPAGFTKTTSLQQMPKSDAVAKFEALFKDKTKIGIYQVLQ
jgi:hypothetical protein